jgi:hypothetical protein
VFDPRRLGVLDAPHARGMTAGNEALSIGFAGAAGHR